MTHVLRQEGQGRRQRRQEGQGRRQRRSVAFKDIEIAYLKTDIDNLKSKLAEAEAQHQIKLVEAEAQHQIKLAEAEAFNKTIHEMLIENIVNLRQKILREFNKHQIELENLRAQYRAWQAQCHPDTRQDLSWLTSRWNLDQHLPVLICVLFFSVTQVNYLCLIFVYTAIWLYSKKDLVYSIIYLLLYSFIFCIICKKNWVFFL